MWYNGAKYLWRCLKCGLLNYEHKCQACFTTQTQKNPIIKVHKTRNKSSISDVKSIEWSKLKDQPLQCSSACFSTNMTNSHDIFVGYSEPKSLIYNYNLQRDEWKQIFTINRGVNHYSTKCRLKIKSLEYNNTSRKCYFQTVKPNTDSGHEFRFFEMDPYTKNMEHSIKSSIQLHKTQLNLWEDPSFQCVNDMNDITHCIGNSNHFACNLQRSSKVSLYLNARPISRANCGLIHISTSNTMIKIGGCSWIGVNSDQIWVYNCSLRSGWCPFPVSLPHGLSSFGCVLTNDQKYIIIIGGESNIGWLEKRVTDNIFVLDLENKTIKQSKIKCPQADRFKALIVPISFKNKLIVFGFLRIYCCQMENKSNDTADFTCRNVVYGKARDIVGIIVTMYDIGNDIHLFSECQGGHWILNANHIINALW